MYKALLCWRYLRTRYIALVTIISVMLGVATMIVVNAVMAGFSKEMQERIHGVLSDITVAARDFGGESDPDWYMEQIRGVAGDQIEGMTPIVAAPGMLNVRYGSNYITHQVQIVGIDEKTHASVGDFGQFLQHPKNREQMSWTLHEGGYDRFDHQSPKAPERKQMAKAGWVHRREMAELQAYQDRIFRESKPQENAAPAGTSVKDAAAVISENAAPSTDPFARPNTLDGPAQNSPPLDPKKDQRTGAVLGIAMASIRMPDGTDRFMILPGDDVKITFPTVGSPPKPVSDEFTVVDLYESKMAAEDMQFVFVPLRRLQEMRGMIDPSTGVGRFNSIQIKLRPGADGQAVRDKLAKAFSPEMFEVSTWREKQGAILAAVAMETAILNVLLFLIIAVAGFGILAIFFMIVVEKTRDIGILRSLGAPGTGVMGIFLGYGLSLGVVGSGVGTVVGLLFVRYINEIADVLGAITGRRVFDPSIYFFYSIPTLVDPWTLFSIVGGALLIAVGASVLPAVHAAKLHPVEALRYE